jgi:hypothetical protein
MRLSQLVVVHLEVVKVHEGEVLKLTEFQVYTASVVRESEEFKVSDVEERLHVQHARRELLRETRVGENLFAYSDVHRRRPRGQYLAHGAARACHHQDATVGDRERAQHILWNAQQRARRHAVLLLCEMTTIHG